MAMVAAFASAPSSACALSPLSASSARSPLSSRPGAPLSLPHVHSRPRLVMSATPVKEHINVAGLTAAALTSAMIIPEIAEAAQPGVSPSLQNLLLSVVAGGVVLLVIGGAVAGVSTFDPVKRS